MPKLQYTQNNKNVGFYLVVNNPRPFNLNFSMAKTKIDEMKRRPPTRSDRGDDLKSKSKDKTYAYVVTKLAQHFPSFDAKACETQLRKWEDYWDSVKAFQRNTTCNNFDCGIFFKGQCSN